MLVFNLLIGLVMLVAGAEMLVRGGGQLALTMRVPALVVGLTIVAFGTSSPELIVSVTAALEASTDMALANVIGSNIANILLVLGLASVVAPLTVDRMLMRREIPTCILLQAMVPILAMDGRLSRGDGLVLLLGGIFYNAWLLYEALKSRSAEIPDDLAEEDVKSWYLHLGMLFGGLLVLIVGADLFVDGAETLARMAGLSDRFVGLSVMALGTSAPEVATGIMSARRGEVELAVGNSLGSNLLNISMVLGITAMITPVVVSDANATTDMWVALGVTAFLIPMVFKGSLRRGEGMLMVAAYFGYVGWGFFV